jgi:hypothetical protein
MSTPTIPFFDGDEAPYVSHALYWDYPVWLRVDPSCSGVYVLIDKREVTYIGKTLNLGKRLLAHHIINYTTVKRIIQKRLRLVIWPCDDPFMSDLEAYLIYCFRPRANSVFPDTSRIGLDRLKECDAVLQELTELIR